jgi:hypothetical protein
MAIGAMCEAFSCLLNCRWWSALVFEDREWLYRLSLTEYMKKETESGF